MKKLVLLIFMFTLTAVLVNASQEGKKVAMAILVRGDVKVVDLNKVERLIKKDDWLREGEVVKTGEKSLAKLRFVDKSSMNVGPQSEMLIEKFSKDEAGVINVISGKLRAQVSKDYLQMDKSKSKMFVKSRSAVMGIRGTDFTFTTNPKTGTSTVVLFEGAVQFSKVDANTRGDLESIVNRGQSVRPGQFSVAGPQLAKATVPAKMNSRQFKNLMNNAEFKSKVDAKSIGGNSASVTPSGLSTAVVSSNNEVVKDLAGGTTSQNVVSDSRGFVKGDDVKPADGTMVHIESGTIIPIAGEAKFDDVSGEWNTSGAGGVSTTGEYVPPEGYRITDDGQLLKEVDGGGVVEVVFDATTSINIIDSFDALPTAEAPSDLAIDRGIAGGGVETTDTNTPIDPDIRTPKAEEPKDDKNCCPPPPPPPGTLINGDGTGSGSGDTLLPPPPPPKSKVNFKVNKR